MPRNVSFQCFMFLDFGISADIFDKKYGVPEAREVFRNLPGARGFVFPKYEPEASHGDPIHDQKSGFQKSGFVLHMPAGALCFFKKQIFVLYMPAGALFLLKKSGFVFYMPAGALFFLKKSGSALYMPAGALFFLKKSIFVFYMPAGAVFFLKK